MDPPPIIQLRTGAGDQTSLNFLQNPYTFVCANLVSPNEDRIALPAAEALTGTLVSSLYRLKDTDNSDGGFFIFGDISIKIEGTFRLRFSLFEVTTRSAASISHNEVSHLRSIVSGPFTVYSSKTFPGVLDSTFLSRSFCDQGVRIKIRKEIRIQVKSTRPADSGLNTPEEHSSRPPNISIPAISTRTERRSSQSYRPYAPSLPPPGYSGQELVYSFAPNQNSQVKPFSVPASPGSQHFGLITPITGGMQGGFPDSWRSSSGHALQNSHHTPPITPSTQQPGQALYHHSSATVEHFPIIRQMSAPFALTGSTVKQNPHQYQPQNDSMAGRARNTDQYPESVQARHHIPLQRSFSQDEHLRLRASSQVPYSDAQQQPHEDFARPPPPPPPRQPQSPFSKSVSHAPSSQSTLSSTAVPIEASINHSGYDSGNFTLPPLQLHQPYSVTSPNSQCFQHSHAQDQERPQYG